MEAPENRSIDESAISALLASDSSLIGADESKLLNMLENSGKLAWGRQSAFRQQTIPQSRLLQSGALVTTPGMRTFPTQLGKQHTSSPHVDVLPHRSPLFTPMSSSNIQAQTCPPFIAHRFERIECLFLEICAEKEKLVFALAQLRLIADLSHTSVELETLREELEQQVSRSQALVAEKAAEYRKQREFFTSLDQPTASPDCITPEHYASLERVRQAVAGAPTDAKAISSALDEIIDAVKWPRAAEHRARELTERIGLRLSRLQSPQPTSLNSNR